MAAARTGNRAILLTLSHTTWREYLDEDLAGTWTLGSGGIVTFEHVADTFARDAQFTASRDHLTGEGTFSAKTFRLVLTQLGWLARLERLQRAGPLDR